MAAVAWADEGQEPGLDVLATVAVGVHGGAGSVVPGVHGLHHAEDLVAADLADQQPVRPEAERSPDECWERDRWWPVGRLRASLEAHDVVPAEW